LDIRSGKRKFGSDKLGGKIVAQDWHEKETKRLNKQSMRRALVASAIIVGLLVWWMAANIHH
jgi:hypothetical protein